MSAALAIAAGCWPCRISYVGGNERTKDGVGIVVSGKEQILHAQNPADALGLLALDTSIELLRTHAFAAAHTTLQPALRRVTDPAHKAELSAVANLAEALANWEVFQHEKALNKLRALGKHTHNLEAALGRSRAHVILVATVRLQTHLQAILDAGSDQPSRALILDLLANARRRLTGATTCYSIPRPRPRGPVEVVDANCVYVPAAIPPRSIESGPVESLYLAVGHW